MSSIRLTNTIREKILAGLIKHRFEAEEKALRERDFDLGQELYEMTYSKDIQAKMAALPDGYFPTAGSIAYSWRKNKDARYVSRNIPLRHWQKIAKSAEYNGLALELDLDSEFPRKDKQFLDDKEDLRKRKENTVTETRSALAAFTTLEKLLGTWPEVAPFVPAVAYEDRKMPVPPVKKLNDALDLPVTKRPKKKA